MSIRPIFFSLLLATAGLSAAAKSSAQSIPAPDPELETADAAMATCTVAAAEKRQADALAHAKVAEGAYRARLAGRPNDVRALVGLARTLGSCRIPSADLALMGELSAESIELLRRALEITPDHWLARYILALNYYRAPSFLGRTGDAARELDRLIAQQGDRTDVPEFARTFEYRGLLWSRAGQSDSASVVWRRGQRLFPSDSALRARLRLSADDANTAAGATSDSSGRGTPARSDSAAVRTPNDSAAAAESLAPVRIEEVRVVVSRSAGAAVQPTPSERRLSRSDVVMAAGGTADVLQAAQLQPGATRVGENAELFVRGGDPAETPTFVDGGRILSVSRFEGLSGSTLGILDPWVVKSARFSTGAFSVRFGNALSGVLNVETDGRPRTTEWRAGLGLAQAGATGRLPLGARSGTWGTVRATHTGALLRTHGRTDEFVGAPHSVEAMGAFVAQPNIGAEYRAVGMIVRDASARVVDANGYRGPFDSEGATHALILSSQHVGMERPVILRSNLVLSQRTTDWSFGVLRRERSQRSGIVRADLEYAAESGAILRAGADAGQLERSDGGTVPTSTLVAPGSAHRSLDVDSSTWNVGGYVESELPVGRFRMLIGARADRLPGETEVSFDPRLTLSTRVGEWTTRLSAGQFHQGRWRAEASIPDAGTPSGLPRQAAHLVAGVERSGAVTIKAEAFLKEYSDYGTFGTGPQIVDGVARGLDLILQRPVGERLTGWVGYSFLNTELDLADGRVAPSPFDVTHTATASATLRVAGRTTLGSTVRFGTGRPFTPVVGVDDAGDGRVVPVYGAPSSDRLPDYSRVDARLTQYMPLRRSMLVGFVEVLNVLDRRNVAGYVWDANFRSRQETHTFYGNRTVMAGFELQSR